MSFFPSPTPSERRCPAMSPSLQYVPPAVTPGSSQPQDDEWAIADTTHDENFSLLQPSDWLSEEPCGLGLLSDSNDAAHSFPSLTPAFQPQAPDIHYTWSPNPTPPASNSMRNTPLRKDSANESCDPLSTLLPGAWDLRSHSLAYTTSPARSDYSMCSYPSAMSSPYALSEGYTRVSGSPFIKIEEPTDVLSRQIYSFSETTSSDQSLLVNPNDLFNEPVPSIEDRVRTCLAPSLLGDTGEWKPPISHLSHPRARSFEDLFEEMSKHRKKRAHTTSENASCSCKVCGKLFQRTYNLKAHMETHDKSRVKANICLYDGCDKRFVRRTDLHRHEQSVHLNKRNFVCHLCDASFARKDTLRRHAEDGCSRRGTVKKRIVKARRMSKTLSVRSTPFPESVYASRGASPKQ